MCNKIDNVTNLLTVMMYMTYAWLYHTCMLIQIIMSKIQIPKKNDMCGQCHIMLHHVRITSLTCVIIFRRYNMSETGVDWKTVPENSTTTVCCTPTAAHNIAPMYFNVSDGWTVSHCHLRILYPSAVIL